MAAAELLKWANIEVEKESLNITLMVILQVASGLLILWERYKKGGVNILGVKK